MTNTVDLAPLISPILGALGLLVASGLTALAGWAINELRKRNILHLTDQQRAQVLGAVQTGAGILVADLARGVTPLERVNISSDQVRALAARAVAAVPEAAAGLGVTEAGAAAMIVGAVGRAIAADPTIPTVAVVTKTEAETTSSTGAVATASSASTTAAA